VNADFASGMTAEQDYTTLVQPAGQPLYGENQAFWMQDEATGIHINGHLNTCEDIGAFNQRIGKLSIIFPDGRTLVYRGMAAVSTRETVSCGNLSYTCVEPFRQWRCTFDGVMQDITVERRYMTGLPMDSYRVPVSFDIDARMGAPAWINGGLSEGGLGAVKVFMGGERYEQLCRISGTLRVGSQSYPIEGAANRSHRHGQRDLAATATAPRMLGHIWAAGLFPSGKGFGVHAFPTAEGGILWSEAHVVRDGQLVPAEIVHAPWLQNYWKQGERFRIVLRTADGQEADIGGEILGTFMGEMIGGATVADQIPIFQSYARYTLDGETATATNMIERSLRRSCIETGVGRPPR
jgi:hypothetical protein